MAGAHAGQKRASDRPKLELQLLRATTWVLGTKTRFSARTASASNWQAISLSLWAQRGLTEKGRFTLKMASTILRG